MTGTSTTELHYINGCFLRGWTVDRSTAVYHTPVRPHTEVPLLALAGDNKPACTMHRSIKPSS